MKFKKPKMKYTEMAMFIDEKTNSDDEITEQDIELIYKYLYHLILMLAYKKKYFNNVRYYEEFSLWFAGDMLYRLVYNPKLKETNEDGSPKLTKIKSVLNYLKVVLYGRKVAFEQQFYSQKNNRLTDSPEIDSEDPMYRHIRNTKRSYIDSEIKIYLSSLAKTLNKFIEINCLYKKDKVMLKNIKISCFLSILNAVTFTEEDKYNIWTKYKSDVAKFNHICRLYKSNRDNCIVLYHLDDDMKDYITVMVRRLFSVIETDLKDLTTLVNYVSDDILADVAFSEVYHGGELWQAYDES